MYRRRFSVPLHSVQPAGATPAPAPPAPPPADKPPPPPTAAAPPPPPADTSDDKENAAAASGSDAAPPPAAGQPVFKKPRMQFVGPRTAAAGPAAGAAGPAAAAATGPRPAAAAAAAAAQDASAPPRIVGVLYCNSTKFSKKKASKGFADGVLKLTEDRGTVLATLLDAEGKVVTKGKAKLPRAPLESGSIIEVGSTWTCEFDKDISLDDFKRGTCFSDLARLAAPVGGPAGGGLGGGSGSGGSSSASAGLSTGAKAAAFKPMVRRPGGLQPAAGGGGAGGAAAAAGGRAPAATSPPGLFDPHAPNAVVVNALQWADGKGVLPSGRPVVPVVIDPYLGRHLRPHQQEGVRFMYECVMGLRSPDHAGCLLADEMGLGKTLQVLALLWTLLRQGPEGVPVVRKAVVVAPATLVANWGKEAKKWLGVERLRFISLPQGPGAAEAVADFKLGTVFKLLIASYEGMRKFGASLAGSCDLLVCDEGHRLKAKGGNKTIDALLALSCARRVVLTGTPIQNRLDEFYALLSFATPGLLGAFGTFSRVYGDVITRSQDKNASAEDKELGAIRAEELKRRTAGFMLRRTQEVLSKHLPPLSVHTLFCRPSALQVEVYKGLLRSKRITSLLYSAGSSDGEGVLPAITVLRKLCNHPALLQQASDGADADAAPGQQQQQQQQQHMKTSEVAAAVLKQHLPATGLPVTAIELSGKLQVLEALLQAAIAEGSKCVVVSTSTSALDLVDALLCQPHGWRSVRIDGSTNVEERQVVVDNFNSRGIGQVFLLSTRAGGAGLNLIGANQLVLFDSDWNPSADLQAMARIWRDGQKRHCFVTRLLTAGTIEEKIYQRQLSKNDLAGAAMAGGGGGGGGGANRLSQEELRQLFHLEAGCSTRKLLEASAGGCDGIVWLVLPGKGQQPQPQQLDLPPSMAAAVGTGLVVEMNRERQQLEQQLAQQQQQDGDDGAGDDAGDTQQQDVQQQQQEGVGAAQRGGQATASMSAGAGSSRQAAGVVMDVDELELEDDGF